LRNLSIPHTWLARLLLVAAVALSPFALSGARAQLLNGGFETYTTGAGAAIANWTTTAQYNAGGGLPNGIETGLPITGLASLDLWSTNTATQTFSLAGPLAATYSLSVTISAYTNTPANNATQTFILSLGNKTQTFTTAASQNSLNPQVFTLTNILLAATGNVLTITDTSQAHSLGYVLFVDSVTLTPTPAPIPGAGLPAYILVALAVLLVNRRRLLALIAQTWRGLEGARPPDGR